MADDDQQSYTEQFRSARGMENTDETYSGTGADPVDGGSSGSDSSDSSSSGGGSSDSSEPVTEDADNDSSGVVEAPEGGFDYDDPNFGYENEEAAREAAEASGRVPDDGDNQGAGSSDSSGQNPTPDVQEAPPGGFDYDSPETDYGTELEKGSGRVGEQAQELEEDVLREKPGLSEDDVGVVREGDQLRPEITEQRERDVVRELETKAQKQVAAQSDQLSQDDIRTEYDSESGRVNPVLTSQAKDRLETASRTTGSSFLEGARQQQSIITQDQSQPTFDQNQRVSDRARDLLAADGPTDAPGQQPMQATQSEQSIRDPRSFVTGATASEKIIDSATSGGLLDEGSRTRELDEPGQVEIPDTVGAESSPSTVKQQVADANAGVDPNDVSVTQTDNRQSVSVDIDDQDYRERVAAANPGVSADEVRYRKGDKQPITTEETGATPGLLQGSLISEATGVTEQTLQEATRNSPTEDIKQWLETDEGGLPDEQERPPEQALESTAKGLVDLFNAPRYLLAGEKIADATDPGTIATVATNAGAAGETATAVGRDKATRAIEFAKENPGKTAGSLGAGAIAAGSLTAGAVKFRGASVPTTTQAIAAEFDPRVSLGGRAVSKLRGDSSSDVPARTSGQSDPGTGGLDSLYDPDQIDAKRGISGPSRRSRVRGRVERGIESFRSQVESTVAKSDLLSDDRGQLQMGKQRQRSTPDADEPSVDYEPSRDDLVGGSPRDRMSDDIADRQKAARQQAGGTYDGDQDPIGEANRRRTEAEQPRVRVGDDDLLDESQASTVGSGSVGAGVAAGTGALERIQNAQQSRLTGDGLFGRTRGGADVDTATDINSRTDVDVGTDTVVDLDIGQDIDQDIDQRLRQDQDIDLEQDTDLERDPDTPNDFDRDPPNDIDRPPRDRDIPRDEESDNGLDLSGLVTNDQPGTSDNSTEAGPKVNWVSENLAALAGADTSAPDQSSLEDLSGPSGGAPVAAFVDGDSRAEETLSILTSGAFGDSGSNDDDGGLLNFDGGLL